MEKDALTVAKIGQNAVVGRLEAVKLLHSPSSHLKIQSISGCRRIERYYKLGIGRRCSAGSAPHLPLRLPLVSHRDGRFPNAATPAPQLNVSSVRFPPSLALSCLHHCLSSACPETEEATRARTPTRRTQLIYGALRWGERVTQRG